jgi:hypothetical protein
VYVDVQAFVIGGSLANFLTDEMEGWKRVSQERKKCDLQSWKEFTKALLVSEQ